MDLMQFTAVELGKKIKNKEVTVKECVEAALAQIDVVEGKIHSFVRLKLTRESLRGRWPAFQWPSKIICVQKEW